MNLLELHQAVENAIMNANSYGVLSKDIPVSLQIDGPGIESIGSPDEVELHYDNDFNASGCVLTAHILED